MRMCSIASGSSGNCIYAGSEKTHLLVDAGISGKRVEAGLKALDLCGRDLSGILVTHEHADHISGLGVLARRYQIPLYMTRGTLQAIQKGKMIGKVEESLFHEITEDEPFLIGDMKVEAFTIPHDAAQPVGYRIENGSRAVGVATDMGSYNDYILSHLRGLDAVLLESNHDVNMLQVGPYPYPLKMRILGERGHLSNETAGRMLGEILHEDMKAVFLGHLSKENNYEQLAFQTVCNEVTFGDNPFDSKDFHIRVASRTEMSEIVTI